MSNLMTFNDDEWKWSGYFDYLYQNKRNPAVFKDGKNGKPYYIRAYIKRASFPDGYSNWSGSLTLDNGKRVRKCYIKDPKNMPIITFDIPVIITGEGSDWEFVPIKESQLDELKKYYDLEIIGGE